MGLKYTMPSVPLSMTIAELRQAVAAKHPVPKEIGLSVRLPDGTIAADDMTVGELHDAYQEAGRD